MSLKVIDLFAGCGGLSLGFLRAGYQIIGAVEQEPHAALTHAQNFSASQAAGQTTDHYGPIDITITPPGLFMRDFLGIEHAEDAVDVITGGPPCQAFSRVGRAKLRDLMDHPEAHLMDERASLYTYFLEYVEYFRPRAVLMENVVDIIRFGGQNVAEEIAWSLQDMGYVCRYTILNAVHYGVPQYRQRFFLLGLRADLGVQPAFPPPTHRANLPAGYAQQQQSVKNAVIQPSLFEQRERTFIAPPLADSTLPSAVTTEEALRDLLPLDVTDLGRGRKAFEELANYREAVEPSEYGLLMRNWPGFESTGGVSAHVTRQLPRDHRIFELMKPGDQYPEAVFAAESLFQEELRRLETEEGAVVRENSEEYEALRSRYVPPYDQSKFRDKWRMLAPYEPVHTLTAHLSRDGYSHIHYDSAQKRVISVREAARLQSFPDGFQFSGGMGPSFKMIGNAVPPLLAYALATKIKTLLEGAQYGDVRQN